MSVQLPIVFSNITSSQLTTQGGQQAIPITYLDNALNALANPVNPVIPITGSISLSTANSGNIYELNNPSANATITLPTPTNGFNAIFVGNNSSSYTYTFSTPSGSILWNNTSSSSVTPNTANGVYFLVSDGTNYILSYELGAPLDAALVSTGVTPGTYGSSSAIPQITVDAKGRITSASSVALPSGTFPTGGNVVSGVINSSISMSNNTTYTIGALNVTFPSFSPTGYFKIIFQIISHISNATSGSTLTGNTFTHTITDGTKDYVGTPWTVVSLYGWITGIGDTIVMGDYAQGSTVTFTFKISVGGGSAGTNAYSSLTYNYAIIY